MTRTFHNSPGLLFALTAVLLVGTAGYLLWMKLALWGVVVLLVAVLVIERTIHSEYVIDDERLVIRRGRLSRDCVVPISQIAAANVFRPVPFLLLFKRSPMVVIVLRSKPRPIIVTPSNPDEFVKAIWKQDFSPAKTMD